jgi:hypothetical protein
MKIVHCFLLLAAGAVFAPFGSCKDSLLKKNNALTVRIDYNVETLGIIFSLADDADWLLEHSNKSGDSYFLKLYRRQFARFKEHAAVSLLDSLTAQHIFSISNPYVGLHYSPLPEFKQQFPFNDEFYKQSSHTKAEVDAAMADFAKQVRQFYKDAGLASFFTQHKIVYSKIQKEVQDSLPPIDFTKMMSDFYGSTAPAQLTIIPSAALFGQWGFGHSIKKDSVTEFFQLLSHGEERDIKDWNEIKPDQNLGFSNAQYNFEFAIHEFGHSFVRFLDKPANQELLQGISYMNNEELQAAMEEQGQDPGWQNVFEEHLVRAIEILVVEKMGNKKAVQEKMAEEKDENHFIYIDAFLSSLRNYEAQREKYPDLEKYFPVLINDLAASHKKE